MNEVKLKVIIDYTTFRIILFILLIIIKIE